MRPDPLSFEEKEVPRTKKYPETIVPGSGETDRPVKTSVHIEECLGSLGLLRIVWEVE